MMAIEYEDEILIVDAGIMFPENDMLGVDHIIPDYNYLMDKKEKVRAILLTHGHEDHVGALPHLLADINVPIYATALTLGLIEIKLKEAKLLQQADLKPIQAGFNFAIDSFNVEPFHVTHSIPDSLGFGITTPVGLIIHTGDYKFDHTPEDGKTPDFAKLAEFSQRGVLCLLADSTNAERPGWTRTEKVVTAALDELFGETKGRIIVATFASHISRIQQVANVSRKHGRKMAITGRSMRENAKIARRLGYLDIPDDLLVDIDQLANMQPGKVTIMATGSQGEPTAVLGRLATGRHRNLTIQPGDTVVISAHPIPGNEEMIYRVINRMMQQGAEVFYEGIANIHVSGHASQEEMKLMINLLRPKFFVPIHGELRHLKQHRKIAEEMGIPPTNIAVVENGTILELTEDSMEIGPRIPGGYIFVDGTGVGDIGPAVMRDREMLAESGFFVAIVPLNVNGELAGKPNIISRGFIYVPEATDLLEGAEQTIAGVVGSYDGDRDKLGARLEEALSKYLYAATGRRPMVYAIVK